MTEPKAVPVLRFEGKKKAIQLEPSNGQTEDKIF
jgi:hypothetical protein